MIVTMKKIYVIVRQPERDRALMRLRELGTVHVEPFGEAADEAVIEMRRNLADIERVTGILKEEQKNLGRPVNQKGCQNIISTAQDVLRWEDQIASIKEDIIKWQAVIHRLEPWGDFDPSVIRELKDRGINVMLCEVPETSLDQLPEEVGLHIFNKTAGIIQCMVVAKGDLPLAIEQIPLPEASIHKMRHMQNKDLKRVEEIKRRITGSLKFLQAFTAAEWSLNQQIKFKEAANGMLAEESLMVLKGYCPEYAVPELEKIMRAETWAYLIEDPTEEDNIPTLLQNPKWVELINPVLKLAGILPDYKEIDTSPLLMLFFSIFFGILIGDAGYGLILLAATAWFDRKFRGRISDRTLFRLIYVLSAATIIWGVLTGIYFGQAWVSSIIPPLVPWLNDIRNMQMVCFLIGAVHLSLAHVWRAILIYPKISFLSQAGWALIVWGMFFMARFLILAVPLNLIAKMCFIAGAFLVVFFTKPDKNPLKSIGSGMAELLMNIINSFSDIVSYIRLFAVSLATVAVADAFNSIAMGIGFSNIFTGLITALILIAGHLFNMVLGAMSILVHGLRLNLLEFSGHMGLTWSGIKYDPFRKAEKSKKS